MTDYLDHARHLAQKLIIIDGHIDAPYRLDIYPEDPTRRCVGGDFDYVRAREGGLTAAFMAIYVASHLQDGGAQPEADKLIDQVWQWQVQHPNHFQVAHTPDDVRRHANTDVVCIPMGIENGAPLQGRIEELYRYFDRGIRYITLCHGKDNHICDSSYDERRTSGGLSDFGRHLIPEMNRCGMMIDVSHVSDEAFWQVMDLTHAPVIASHSSLRHFTPGFQRNISDDMMRRVAEGGGVVMISFASAFLRNDYREQDDQYLARAREAMQQRGLARGSHEALSFFSQQRRDHPVGTVHDVADHIDHAVQVAGIDHVGLGSDFDGVFSLPHGLLDVAAFPNLMAALLERGYHEDALAKIMGENTLRVWGSVLQHRA